MTIPVPPAEPETTYTVRGYAIGTYHWPVGEPFVMDVNATLTGYITRPTLRAVVADALSDADAISHRAAMLGRDATLTVTRGARSRTINLVASPNLSDMVRNLAPAERAR